MHAEGFFMQALVYLAAAVVAVPIAKRLGLGSVLGYLLAGMVIGPFGIGLVGEEGQDVMHFAEFGVVMMLFLVGLELKPALLWKMRGPILGLGGLQVGVTAAGVAAVGLTAGLPWQQALALGLILALSSTAISLQVLSEKGLLNTHGGQSSFAVLLFQDIAVIPMLAILPLLAHGGGAESAGSVPGTGWVDGLSGWARTALVLGSVVGIVAAGRFLIGPIFRVIARTRLQELFTAAALLLVVGIAQLMTLVGLSPALGTFLAGVVLATSEYRHELEADIAPFKGLLLGLFFIAVGASVNFALIAASPLLIAGLVLALVAGKFILLFLLGRGFRLGLDQGLLFAFALAQGGEFAFVLFSFAGQQAVLPAAVIDPLVAVVALSMATTPLLMVLAERVILPRVGTRAAEDRPADEIDAPGRVIIAGFGRFGNIVGRLLRANGERPVILDLDSDNVEVLRKLGLKVFYGDASRLDLLRSAGAEGAAVLVLAVDEPEKIRELVRIAQKHFPGLKILARAHSRTDAYELLNLGVDQVFRETLDTSLRMGVEALRLLGRCAHQAHRSAALFRRHDEKALKELADLHHDRSAYLSRARQRIRDLEEIMLLEMTRGDETRDAGWDTGSLRAEMEELAAAGNPGRE